MTSDQDSGRLPEDLARAGSAADSPLTPDVDIRAGATPVSADAQTPDLGRTGDAIEQPRSRSIEVTVLTVLALLYSLYFARDFLIPIVFAVLLNFLLSPAIRFLRRYHIKPPVSAAFVILLLLGGFGGAVYQLAGPAQSWAATAPQTFARAQYRLRKIIRPMQQVTKNVEQAADVVGGQAADVVGGQAADSVGGRARPAPQVVVRSGPSMSARLFGGTQRLVAGILQVLLLLYFLLAGGDLFLQKLIKVLPHFGDKVKAVEIARATEAAISAYLTTTLIVNIGEGAVLAGALWLLGMPNVFLWGALAACLEFVPYLGGLAMAVVLLIAGLSAFPDLGHALLIPGSFLVINLIQANVVSPVLLGSKLTLNPVAIFIGLAFFFWIWGVPGAFLAVPLLATFKIFCDHIAALAAIGEFLGRRDDGERRVTARV